MSWMVHEWTTNFHTQNKLHLSDLLCWLLFWSTVAICTSGLVSKWNLGQSWNGCEWLSSSVMLNNMSAVNLQACLRIWMVHNWPNASLHLCLWNFKTTILSTSSPCHPSMLELAWYSQHWVKIYLKWWETLLIGKLQHTEVLKSSFLMLPNTIGDKTSLVRPGHILRQYLFYITQTISNPLIYSSAKMSYITSISSVFFTVLLRTILYTILKEQWCPNVVFAITLFSFVLSQLMPSPCLKI